MVTIKNVKREGNTVSCIFVPEGEKDNCAGTLTINKKCEVVKHTLSSKDREHYAPYLRHAYLYLCETWELEEDDIPEEKVRMWY